MTFVVGLSSHEAIRFEAVKQTVLDITARKSMATAIQESRIRQAGAWASFRLSKHALTVYSISRVDFHDETYEKLADAVGREPHKFIVLNGKAMDVINAHGICLPPVLGRIESTELPLNLTTELNTIYTELLPV